MKLGLAYLLTLSLVVPHAMAQTTNPCLNNPNGLLYWCSTQGRCVANANVCTAGATTSGTAWTTDPCVNNVNGLRYWCRTQGRCVANANVCTVGSTTSSTATPQSSGMTSSISSTTQQPACNTDPNAPFWCVALQKCVMAAAACPPGYTSFTGPKSLACDDQAYCKSYLTSQGKCPNDSITLGSYFLKKNNGLYTIGPGCTVSCRGCEDSGTYVAPSGTSVAPGYVYGGTTINAPGGGNKNGGGGGGGGNNKVAVPTPNGIAYFNPNTGETTYTSGGGGGKNGRKLRGA